MAHVIDAFRVGRKRDRRIVITDDDRALIKKMHKEGEFIRAIERYFERRISRRSIQFVLFPERLLQMQTKHKEEKHHLKFYNKDKWREYMRTHRAYKKKLFADGLIKN